MNVESLWGHLSTSDRGTRLRDQREISNRKEQLISLSAGGSVIAPKRLYIMAQLERQR